MSALGGSQGHRLGGWCGQAGGGSATSDTYEMIVTQRLRLVQMTE